LSPNSAWILQKNDEAEIVLDGGTERGIGHVAIALTTRAASRFGNFHSALTNNSINGGIFSLATRYSEKSFDHLFCFSSRRKTADGAVSNCCAIFRLAAQTYGISGGKFT